MAKRRRVPGISPNPMTNLIVTDIMLRTISLAARRVAQAELLKTGLRGKEAEKLAKRKSLRRTLFSAGLARLATRSIPGAMVVSGGVFAKTLYDRSKSRRARHEGNKKLQKSLAKAED
ncbi:hypothetical protein RM533_01790 [Croceicoccus sp. F390]|uniref:Uncharacterized protein n=1 Tax=Croceicoccus esteveae TaxID=3075597 RepID=A0ABU2ZE88_9SPHN|nr:hypothetical protein [Croceicoccus sp. F390]MDT0574912.1 hypothetical protein [Croceicoccus sp. F390]